MTDFQGQLDDIRAIVGEPLPGRPPLTQGLHETRTAVDKCVAEVDDFKVMIAALTAEIAALKTSAPVATVPAIPVAPLISSYPVGAYKLPIRPLTNGEQRNAIDALVRGGYEGAPQIELDFTKGIYPVQNAVVVERVKEVYFGSATPTADKDALRIFLSAIDQRVPRGDGTFASDLLPPDDPRIVPIMGTLGVTLVGNNPATSTQVVYTDSVVMVNPETGFTNWISTSQNDDGLTVLYNTKYPWQNGAPSNPKLPQMLGRWERDGGISLNGTAPQQKADGTPVERTPWDGLPGKDLVIYPNGFNRDGLGKSDSVDICSMKAGRNVRIGASATTANPQFHLVVTPDGVNQT